MKRAWQWLWTYPDETGIEPQPRPIDCIIMGAMIVAAGAIAAWLI